MTPFLLICAMFAAQSGAQQPEMASHDAPATFQTRVNLVSVPVVVRDRRGHVIGNLTKEDFQLLDKGKAQVITKFSIEKPGSPVVIKEEGAPDGNGAEKASGPAIPQRYVAYLFDDVHLSFGDLAQARIAWNRHLVSLRATDRAAIFSTSGQTMLDFTDDRQKLQETLNRLQPRSIARASGIECPNVTYYMADLIQNKNDAQALQAATLDAVACLHLDPSTQMQMARSAAQAAAIQALSAGDHETRVSLDVLKSVVRRINAMPGQRSIVLVSPGFYTPNLQQDVTDIIDRAIHASVVISSLDARGLYGDPAADASRPMNDATAGRMELQYQRDSDLIDADVMAELAEGTGGTFFHNSNDLYAGFQQVAAAPEFFYILGYSPENLKMDGSYHRLKVTLKNSKDLALQARRGYYAPKHGIDPVQEAKQEIEDALFSQEEMHDIPIELHTQFFKTGDADAKLAVLARVDVRHLHFRKVDGRDTDNLTVLAGLFDRNGNYINGIEKVIEMHLRDGTLENKLGSGITVKTSFDVKPGGYVVRLVVRDAEGQTMSAANGAVEIP